MCKVGCLQVSSRILGRNFHDLAQKNSAKQHSEQSRKPLASNKILKCVYHVIVSDQPLNSFECFLLSHFLTWMMQYRYLYAKNYKAINTYHQVFFYPESGNAKRENPMVYCANFTQCVCTGYCETWILSLPSFIMNSCSTKHCFVSRFAPFLVKLLSTTI